MPFPDTLLTQQDLLSEHARPLERLKAPLQSIRHSRVSRLASYGIVGISTSISSMTSFDPFNRNQPLDKNRNICVSLESSDNAIVSGFGKFSANGQKESKGWNPACGEDAILSATPVVMV
jgi:hypothetical protein